MIAAIADRVADVAVRTRERIEAVTDDAVTEGFMIEVATTLEKQRWMLQAARRH